ncbi:hypothetical protein [Duganella sp. FT27W]|uniref:hypothetical protein n=1 Tax=Duganella sp. FT27W TaxID=2654636 RepID=UPI00128E0376|nr:hypothetical protein [Duganella sp. FT27W]MPQ56378.1 hypothetical protein [Duganella sp. FT27W]
MAWGHHKPKTQRENHRGWRINPALPAGYRLERGYPERQNVIWTCSEDDDVVAQALQGFSVAEIASYHLRSIGSIRSRLARHGLEQQDRP